MHPVLTSLEEARLVWPDLVAASLDQVTEAFRSAGVDVWKDFERSAPVEGRMLNVGSGECPGRAVTLDVGPGGRVLPRELSLVVLGRGARAEVLDGCVGPRYFGSARARRLVVVLAEGAELVVTTARHASGGAVADVGFALVGRGASIVWRNAALAGGAGSAVIERTILLDPRARMAWTSLAAAAGEWAVAAGQWAPANGGAASSGTAESVSAAVNGTVESVRAAANGAPATASVRGPQPNHAVALGRDPAVDSVREEVRSALASFPGVIRVELVEVLRLMQAAALG